MQTKFSEISEVDDGTISLKETKIEQKIHRPCLHI